MKIIDVICWVLVIIGGINWGCVGFFDFNLVDFFFGNTIVEKVIYDAVGVSAVIMILRARKSLGSCSSKRG